MLRAAAVLPLRQAQRIGAGFGAMAWQRRSNAARITHINVATCFPEKSPQEVNALARESLRSTGRLSAEMGMVWHWPERHWQRTIARVQGEDLFTEAQQSDKGVMVISPHFGNWEILNLYLGKRYGLMVLYDPPRIATLDAMLRRARMRAGGTLVPAGTSGLRTFSRALRQGGVVGLLPDQVPAHHAGVYAPFFGRQALTPTLPARLMRRIRPAVVFGTATRLDDGEGFALAFERFDYAPHLGDDETLATALNAEIERIVRAAPDQYQWEYRRFKRPPPGTPRLY